MKIAVLGAGSFGKALAYVFAPKFDKIALWSRSIRQPSPGSADVVSNIEATVDLQNALSGARFVLIALPMAAVREVMEKCVTHLADDAIIISTTKGIDATTLEFPSQIITKALKGFDANRLVVLSGPNFASEIVQDLPWAAVAASSSSVSAQMVQKELNAKSLRLYHSSDVLGVELGGAIKNVYAIAAGVVDGLNLGCNARAALITRALAEITRFGNVLGAKEKTLYGLSGLGDLLLSCTSEKSRNWRLGNALANHKSLETIQEEMGEVIEGVGTAKAVKKMAEMYGIDAPICEGVYSVIFEKASIQNIVNGLLSRNMGKE